MTKWEVVTEERDGNKVIAEQTARLSVPGGWLYRTYHYFDGRECVAMVFVPDPPNQQTAEVVS